MSNNSLDSFLTRKEKKLVTKPALSPFYQDNGSILQSVFGSDFRKIPENIIKNGDFLDLLPYLQKKLILTQDLKILGLEGNRASVRFKNGINIVLGYPDFIYKLFLNAFIVYGKKIEGEQARLVLSFNGSEMCINRTDEEYSVDGNKYSRQIDALHQICLILGLYQIKPADRIFGYNALLAHLLVDLSEKKTINDETRWFLFGGNEIRELLFWKNIVKDKQDFTDSRINHYDSKFRLAQNRTFEMNQKTSTLEYIKSEISDDIESLLDAGFNLENIEELKTQKLLETRHLEWVLDQRHQDYASTREKEKEDEKEKEHSQMSELDASEARLRKELREKQDLLDSLGRKMDDKKGAIDRLKNDHRALGDDILTLRTCPCGTRIEDDIATQRLDENKCPICANQLPSIAFVREKQRKISAEIATKKDELSGYSMELAKVNGLLKKKELYLKSIIEQKMNLLNVPVETQSDDINLDIKDIAKKIVDNRILLNQLNNISLKKARSETLTTEIKSFEKMSQKIEQDKILYKKKMAYLNKVWKNLHDRTTSLQNQIVEKYLDSGKTLKPMLWNETTYFTPSANGENLSVPEADFDMDMESLMRAKAHLIFTKEFALSYYLSILSLALKGFLEIPPLIVIKGATLEMIEMVKPQLEDLENNGNGFQIIFLTNTNQEGELLNKDWFVRPNVQ